MAGSCFSFTRFSQVASPTPNIPGWEYWLAGHIWPGSACFDTFQPSSNRFDFQNF